MTRLMATILLCFLPLASYADIYICLPRHYAEANQNFTMVVNKDEFDDESRDPETYGWKVDTQRGIVSTAMSRYEGSCEEDDELIRCEKERGLEGGDRGFAIVVINKSKLQFAEVSVNAEYSTGSTVSGTCIKA
jgi:hypothetical protein